METTTDTVDGMSGTRNKITRVSDVIDQINELRKERDEIQKKLNALEGMPLQNVSPIPSDFDYKPAILRLFAAPTTVLSVDNIVAGLAEKNGFVPDRNTVAIRVGYLADSAKPKQLERVPERRGFYRLKHDAINDSKSSDG